MREKIIKKGIEYVLHGNHYVPNLTLAESKFRRYQLGKYVKMRLNN